MVKQIKRDSVILSNVRINFQGVLKITFNETSNKIYQRQIVNHIIKSLFLSIDKEFYGSDVSERMKDIVRIIEAKESII